MCYISHQLLLVLSVIFMIFKISLNNNFFSQRKLKLLHLAPLKQSNNGISSTPPFKSLLSSAVATVVNRQEMSAFFPLHQLMQHNYIIKTCMTTYTYLTTVVQNKRSAVSTFETIVSVVTTESLTNLYATDVFADIKPTKVRYRFWNPTLTSWVQGPLSIYLVPPKVSDHHRASPITYCSFVVLLLLFNNLSSNIYSKSSILWFIPSLGLLEFC